MLGDTFSQSSMESDTLATKGELGGPSLSELVDDCIVTSYSLRILYLIGEPELSFAGLASDRGEPIPIVEET